MGRWPKLDGINLYCIVLYYKRAVDSKLTAYFPARPKLLTGGRTDRWTRCLKRGHSQKVMQRVEVQSQQNKACGADCMSKKTTKSI